MSKLWIVVASLIAACVLGYFLFFNDSDASEQTSDTTQSTEIANPASVYCGEQGGTLDIRLGDDGGQVGYCVFDEGQECEEWAYYRGECLIEQ